MESIMKTQAHQKRGRRTGCLICGKEIVYSARSVPLTCDMCGGAFESNAACADGHYICDKCHTLAQEDFLLLLRRTEEKDPVKLFYQTAGLESVHMHGPEHHSIVSCVMLAAYHNSGGEIDLEMALEAAMKRGAQVPGGTCGFWGACGAAIGAGIYASVVTGSNPLNAEVWSIPQHLTSRCLSAIAMAGGPRCCKRTSRIAIDTSVRFTMEYFGVEIPTEYLPCTFYAENNECLHGRCPFYGGRDNAV